MFSSTSSARASIGNGGGAATRSTSTSHSPISISPVGRFGLTVPSGRTRTTPVTRTTYSLRTSTALSTTHCTDAGEVTDVDEGQMLAVFTAPGNPPAHRHGLADIGVAQLPTGVGAHRGRAGRHVGEWLL